MFSGNNRIFPYKNQAVRDLAWVVASAPIIDGIDGMFFTAKECVSQYLDFEKKLEKLDENPEPLLRFLEKKKSKLIGKRFEYLVEYWLSENEKIELIAAGLQANESGKTRGEFDFIYSDKTIGEFVHLEVAGKFYLWRGKTVAFSNFRGPNPNDNLEKKLKQIFSKQIRLSKTIYGKNALAKLNVGEVTPKICFKGYVFYPYGTQPLDIFPKGHSYGYWINKSEIKKLEGDFWQIIERQNWISPLCCAENFMDKTRLLFEINKYFERSEYPLLIANLSRSKSGFYEKERIFVLP